MGGGASKQEFRTAILDLVNSKQSVTTLDDSFWDRFWSDPTLTSPDYFTLVTSQDIRELRDKASGNLTALCFKLVERISAATATACSGDNEQKIVLNCVSLLTRLLPFLFEAPDWRLLFWSPANFLESHDGEQPQALAQVLLNSLADLLFCPDFTIIRKTKAGPENPDDLSSLDSCEYIWEAGIGCVVSPGTTKQIDNNRSAILKLLITCFSENLYISPAELGCTNRWLSHFSSPENRHVLPLLTSLVNVICAYDPVGYGVPYYYAMVSDPRGELVEVSAQLLCILLDYTPPTDFTRQAQLHQQAGGTQPQPPPPASAGAVRETGMGNLFCSFVSRLHQTEDLELIASGLTKLLCNPLRQTYLPHSIKKIYFSQELYIIIWKLFELNQKFLIHILRSAALFDLVVPLLYQLLETRTNPALVGMLHVGVFILLLLSGERNFGVRLNKPYTKKIILPDIPKCTGTHADLLFLVFHKIITSGLPRLQPLYDCLLTVMVNVSPYLKTLTMVTCARLMHLLEAFSTPWFLFAKPTNHYLVFYLLEIFNNIVQYQFDGNTNLIYSIIRSKSVFYQLANLPEESYQLAKPRHQQEALPQGFPPTSVETETPETEVQPQQQETTDGSTSDREAHNLHVADIAPPGRIQTVEVEVEPKRDSDGGNCGSEGESKEPLSPTDKDDAVKPTTSVDSEEPQEQESPGAEPTVSQPSPEAEVQPPQQPELHTSSIHPPPTHFSSPGSSIAGLNPAIGQASSASNLPPMSMTNPDVVSQPVMKKKTKPKPILTKDLLPLHKEVGYSNKQLLEPSTPEFKPTPEWVRSWKQKLPLNTVVRVLQVLVPQVEKLCTENNVKSEHEILEYLKNGTLVGLLPVPHPILIRKYQTSENTELWFHTYIWGVIYVRNFDPPIWYDTTIKLFQVHKPALENQPSTQN